LTPTGPEKPQRTYEDNNNKPRSISQGNPPRGVRFQDPNDDKVNDVNSYLEQLRLSSVEREFRKRIAGNKQNDGESGSDGEEARNLVNGKLDNLRRLEAKKNELKKMLRLAKLRHNNKKALTHLLSSTFNSHSPQNTQSSQNILKNHEKYLSKNTYPFLQVLAYHKFENFHLEKIVGLESLNENEYSCSILENTAEEIAAIELEKYLQGKTSDQYIPLEWKQVGKSDPMSNPFSKPLSQIYENNPDKLHDHIEYLSNYLTNYNLENKDITNLLSECPEILYDYKKWSQNHCGGDQHLEFRVEGMLDRNIFPFFRKDLKINLKTAPRAWLLGPMSHQVAKLFYLMRDMSLAQDNRASGKTKQKRTFLFNDFNNQTKKLMYGGLINYSLLHIQSRHQFLLRRGQWAEPNVKGVIEGNEKRNVNPIKMIKSSEEEFILNVVGYSEEKLEEGLAEFNQFKKIFIKECQDELDILENLQNDLTDNENLYQKDSYHNRVTSQTRIAGRNDFDRGKVGQILKEKYEEEAIREHPIENTIVNLIRKDL